MAELRYFAMGSVDGFIEDASGGFGWAEPDEEVHAFANDAARDIGTHLYGRRMYEVMKVWQDSHEFEGDSAAMREFGEIWRAADKVVFSTTLADVETPRTRLERDFDPEAVRSMKADAAAPISVAGPGLAAVALRAGLVDVVDLVLFPLAIGSGKPMFPADLHVALELVDQRRFASGVISLRYAVA